MNNLKYENLKEAVSTDSNFSIAFILDSFQDWPQIKTELEMYGFSFNDKRTISFDGKESRFFITAKDFDPSVYSEPEKARFVYTLGGALLYCVCIFAKSMETWDLIYLRGRIKSNELEEKMQFYCL